MLYLKVYQMGRKEESADVNLSGAKISQNSKARSRVYKDRWKLIYILLAEHRKTQVCRLGVHIGKKQTEYIH